MAEVAYERENKRTSGLSCGNHLDIDWRQMEGFDIMVEYLLKKYADGKIDNKVMSKYCKNSLSKINI